MPVLLSVLPIDSYILTVKYEYVLGIMEKKPKCFLHWKVHTVFISGFTFQFILVNQILTFQKDFSN